MDGAAIQSPQQREILRGDQQQTKLLQTSIHRYSKPGQVMLHLFLSKLIYSMFTLLFY